MSLTVEAISPQLINLHKKYQHILEAEKSANETLIEQYILSLNDLDRKYLSSPPTRPRELTIPEIFHRSYDENFLSDYLAYILDPSLNGIGLLPILSLIQNLIPEIQEIEIVDVEIQREFDVGGGRIDFLIKIDDSIIIGIENKLYSPEGDQQTNFYARRITSEFPDYECYFIFLTPGGIKASSRKFVSVSYGQVWELFKSIQYDWQSDIRKSVYWEDFLTHLEVYIMGQEKFEFSPRAKLYINNYQMIEDLQNSFKQDWQKLIEMIESKLVAHLPGLYWKTSFNPRRYHYHQIINSNWDYPNLAIHYEYHFSPTSLASSKFAFMFDVEGKRAKDFISLFEEKLPLIDDTYENLNIHFLPNNRKIAVAYKKYQFETPPDSWDIEFIKAYDEFSFLNDYIDKTIEEMRLKDSKS